MSGALAKVYWSDDIFIDPNVIFGTANVQSVWSTPPGNDQESSPRRQSLISNDSVFQRRRSSSRWTQSMMRLNSLTGITGGVAATRRGTLLSKKVEEVLKLSVVTEARLSRQNSLDSFGASSPSTPTQVKSTAKKKFVSLARAGSTVRQLFRGNRNPQSIDVDELGAVDKFKVMVRKIQVNHRWSGEKGEKSQQRNASLGQIVTELGMGASAGGDETGAGLTKRTVSFGDVTMGAIHKNVDRKKLLRLHKWGQEYNRKRRLISKFQRAAKLIIFCRKLCNEHSVKSQEPNEFSPFIKIDFQEGYEPDDLLFDPSKFKANKESRITEEFIRIMSKMEWDRTPQEIYYAQIALRNIECLQDFPARMQQKIAERGMYEKFNAKRVLVRQGHPASCYYFILSGAVAVMVLEQGEAFAKPVAYLTKGQTFGELAIINRSRRQSSIIAREESQFLTISIDDYHDIFMAGGVKNMTDPDHDEFLKSLTCLKGWPLNLLHEKANKCLFLYFKRGDVLVKDSQYSDWIIVVKSGSLAVLKKLKKVLPYHIKDKTDSVNFVSEKAKRDNQNRRTLWKKLILPEINVPMKNSDDDDQGEDYRSHFDEVGHPIPFQHPDPSDARIQSSRGLGHRKIWNFSGRPRRQGAANFSHIQQQQVQLPQIVIAPAIKTASGTPAQGLQTYPEAAVSSNQQKSSKPDQASLEVIDEVASPGGFQSQIRTIHNDLDAGFARKDPGEITAADLNPEFVHIQTLTKGRVFGLSDLILGQQTSFCVVSNGADCLLINKQMFLEHMPESLYTQLRLDLCPYPTEEELQKGLKVSVDWQAYKGITLANTLSFVRKRRVFERWLKT
ncbi:hypothetical protein RRG08_040529 [Elysia crispata]|uniref:Cyclic nucleotide-binding domain-containing protein n=1 Tax=Elysia crispata TaxID=231223 RepID=A0AAE0Z550_9GAST|nr:hypothetical protein RRG08_040529 [Elysia crispata]